MVKWLVEERNVDVNAKDDDGRTVLHYAAWGRDLEKVKWLVEARKVDIRLTDTYGRTASDWGEGEVSSYLAPLELARKSPPVSATKQ
jgi:ankyrin repeat protein